MKNAFANAHPEATRNTVPFSASQRNRFVFDMASAGVKLEKLPVEASEGGVIEKKPQVGRVVETKPRATPKRPEMYKVILLNDNTTPHDFVVHMLRKHFNMPEMRAVRVMREADQSGAALVALFSKEIAETKVDAANKDSRSHVNPIFNGPMELCFTCEPER